MDVHHVPGAEALDLAEAHSKDIQIQDEYHCKCMTYWLDETRGNAFCLIEAPDRAGVEEMHRHSHGLVPHKIIEVSNDLVESFLGRIHDPDIAPVSDNGLKVFSESALRILLVTDITDPVLLRNGLGSDRANDLIAAQNSLIRRVLRVHGGREVDHSGNGFIASFSSASSAISCAIEIYGGVSAPERQLAGLRIAASAGEPIAQSEKLFGDALKMARNLCYVNSKGRIVISSAVKNLVARDSHQLEQGQFMTFSAVDEDLLGALVDTLEENWQTPEFDVLEFCQAMAMSKSQLYRKTMALWGMPPNPVIREYRLDKARELLKKQTFNISQTTFDSGFNSPSYFTKCFKKKFGLLPAAYQNSHL
jgi:AraC-like DNA-binding protein